jgi:hypothetical protein
MYTKTETYSRRDAIRGISLRLARVQQAAPLIFKSRHGILAETLCQNNLYFPLETQSATAEFFWTLLVYQLFAFQQANESRDKLACLLAMDEGLSLWNAQAAQHAKIEGTTLLSEIASRGREFGLGLVVTSTSVNLTDQLLKSNVYTRIAFNVYDGKESAEIARTFSLNPQQHTYFERRLTRGTCIMRLGDRWKDPILVNVPLVPYHKGVTHAEWTAAKERTEALIEKEERMPISPTAIPVQPIAASPAPPAPTGGTSQRASQPRVATAPTNKIALNANERALLERIIGDPCWPCTWYYKQCALHKQAGDRARKKLALLALIEEQPTVFRAGTGGKGVGLRATRKGYELLNKKPRNGTRGGDSIQHEYLVRSLARALRVQPEVSLG